MTPSRTATWHPAQSLIAALFALGAALLVFGTQARADADPFFGTYTGSAEVVALDGSTIPRDMSVEISGTDEGFKVQWTSLTYRADGSTKEKSYTIDFVPSGRDAVYAAAQKRNVFGHEVQLDPMKGEPYVWARLTGQTMTVYSLFVDADGGYSLQQYDRTLADGGLQLRFQTIRDGEIQRAVETFLSKQ
ncbi:MAG: hypothetical protein AAF214_10220 [Pseudomonadota bacterium]